jgi:uncharacterized repeat protein (TIGR03806 family)
LAFKLPICLLQPRELGASTAAVIFCIIVFQPLSAAGANNGQSPYGLPSWPETKPYLLMPESDHGSFPQHLSQTGAFRDTATVSPALWLIPYDLNVAFWSDGAFKSRWMALPNENGSRAMIGFVPTGEWTFPNGTVFVKHFELGTDDTHPETRRRLETRLLVCDSTGGVYGVTYKWRADNTDAELLTNSLAEPIAIKTASGVRTQVWYYPSPADCRTCHTTNAGRVLGVKTRQLNRDYTYTATSVTDNQLRAWNHIGLFLPKLNEAEISTFARLVRSEDASAPLEQRARSYLDANCSQCHRPGGVVSYLDARFDTPLSKQNLIDAPVVIDQGLDSARAIAPNDIWRSVVLLRVSTLDAIRMPPLAHEMIDQRGAQLLREWIQSLPGPQVLAPPTISPAGGEFKKAVKVTLQHPEPGAVIRYTLDGSVPGKSAAIYEHPIELTDPATLRAKAFKTGFTKSVTVQETFMVGD